MALFINQGKHKIEEQKIYVIEDAKMQITKVGLGRNPGILLVTMKFIDGADKGFSISDAVSFDPNSPVAYKYQRLRASAGVPYKEGEAESVDIEALLLNKIIRVKLGKRNYTNKDGEDTVAQNVIYKKPEVQIDEEDLPFKEPVEKPTQQSAGATAQVADTKEDDGWL